MLLANQAKRYVIQMVTGMPAMLLFFLAIISMAANAVPGSVDPAVLRCCVVPNDWIGLGITLTIGFVGGLLVITAPREPE